MDALKKLLVRNKIVSGKIEKNTSHSRMGQTFDWLRGIPPTPFVYREEYNYGSALHEEFLERKKTKRKLTIEERQVLLASLKALFNHPIVQMIMKGSTTEDKEYKTILGVKLAYILDIFNKKEKRGGDLKTTATKTLEEFIDSCLKFGYFRQGVLYTMLEKLVSYFIIAITKAKKPTIKVISFKQYPQHVFQAEQEVKFLLFFSKKYGVVNLQDQWLQNK